MTSFATELATPNVMDERTYVTYGRLTAKRPRVETSLGRTVNGA